MGKVEERVYTTDHNFAPYNCNLGNTSLKRAFGYLHDLNSFEHDLENYGFNKMGEVGFSKGGSWTPYYRAGYKVKNFAAESTVTHSAVALRRRSSTARPKEVIARVSTKPFGYTEFIKDLGELYQAFFERPLIMGIRPRLFRETETPIIGAAGMMAGAAVSYLAGADGVALLGAMVGTGVVLESGNWVGLKLGERELQKRVPNLAEYWTQKDAIEIIKGQEAHIVEAQIKTEIYSDVFKGTRVTIEDFLNDIYGQLPDEIVEARRKEIRINLRAERNKRGYFVSGGSAEELSRIADSINRFRMVRMANFHPFPLPR